MPPDARFEEPKPPDQPEGRESHMAGVLATPAVRGFVGALAGFVLGGFLHSAFHPPVAREAFQLGGMFLLAFILFRGG